MDRWSEFLPTVESKFWAVWNCRYMPGSPDETVKQENPLYLKNCRAAAVYFVDSYLFSPAESRPPFREMILQMHVLLTGGLSMPDGSYQSKDKSPDRFRAEVESVEKKARNRFVENPIPAAFEKTIGNYKGTGPLKIQIEFPENYAGFLPRFTLEFEANAIGETGYGFSLNTIAPPIPRKAEIVGDEGVDCSVLPNKEMDRVLSQAGKLLEEIIADDPVVLKDDEKRRETFFLKVARYYQLMMVCHPFLSQNNSMMVNQINCVLYYYAGKFMTHTVYIDSFAYALPAEAFEKYFLFVLNNLPTVASPVVKARG